MKNSLNTVALAALLAASPLYAADIGVSVSIGQPGFYGQIDIGDYPRPQVIYSEPRIVERVYVDRDPIYLRVPPGHAKHWDKHCYEYHACDRRVYFVQDDWYTREYAPRYQERHRERYDERRDDHDDHDHGKGNGNGKGHGHGRGHDD